MNIVYRILREIASFLYQKLSRDPYGRTQLVVSLKYPAPRTLYLGCDVTAGRGVQRLYVKLTLYSPYNRAALCSVYDYFDCEKSFAVERFYGRELYHIPTLWEVLEQVSGGEPTSKHLELPWILEYSSKPIARYAPSHVKSPQVSYILMLKHIFNTVQDRVPAVRIP
jgi:hypothetical protein